MFSGLFIRLKSSAYGKMRTVWTLPMALDVTRSIVSFSIYFHLLQIRSFLTRKTVAVDKTSSTTLKDRIGFYCIQGAAREALLGPHEAISKSI